VKKSRFIPSFEIERLSNASLECFISDVNKAISLAENLLPGNAKLSEILATHSSHAIVLTEDQRVFQVSFSKGLDGITIGDVLPRDVKVFEGTDQALEEAAQTFLSGDKDRAIQLLRDIAPLVEQPAEVSTSALVENTLSSFAADRPWKKLFFEKGEEIAKVAGEEDDSLQAKFEKILKSQKSGPDLDFYKELVLRDIGELTKRTSEAAESVTHSFAQAESVSDVHLGNRFSAFATDLADDLLRNCKALDEVRTHVQDVKELARVHDAFASRWSEYSAATRFVEKLATNLSAEADAS